VTLESIQSNHKEKVLLALLPFWDPQIPPLGIACIKSYIQQAGYNVKAVDANIEIQFREIYDRYFQSLIEIIPGNKTGNLYNIGNQVFRNHLMVHFNHSFDDKYVELINILISETFFSTVNRQQVKALDAIIEDFYRRLKRYVLDLLVRENPTLFGLSVYGDTLASSLAALKWAKEMNPGIKTVIGGGIFADQMAPGSPNLEYLVERTSPYVDKFIIGEGEELLLRCLKGELDDERKVFGLQDTGGHYIDIKTMDIPDFSDFDLQYYPHLAHFGARSCPFQCNFCSETINWGRYRRKDTADLVDEFTRLYRRYGSQLYMMTDSTLNPVITALANQFIASDVAIYWDGFLRADKHVCDIENTMLWRKGGFYRAKLGLESGSQRLLDLMDKRITIQQSENALASLAYAGIKTTTFWLFGYPGETEDDFQKTLDFVARCKDNIYEADCNAFNYFLTGQANSDEWLARNEGVLLYPEWAGEMLISQTWVLNGSPGREEAYQRVNRFVQHCKKLGIPNPYSLEDVVHADKRWRELHKNAVPDLVELKNSDTYIDESRNIKTLSFAENTQEDDEDWF